MLVDFAFSSSIFASLIHNLPIVFGEYQIEPNIKADKVATKTDHQFTFDHAVAMSIISLIYLILFLKLIETASFFKESRNL